MAKKQPKQSERLNRDSIDGLMHSLPKDDWANSARSLIEASGVALDQCEDVQQLRGMSINCRQQAETLKATGEIRRQLGAKALIGMALQLDERALTFDIPKTPPKDPSIAQATDPVKAVDQPPWIDFDSSPPSSTTGGPMRSDRPTHPGPPINEPPPGNITQVMGGMDPIPSAEEEASMYVDPNLGPLNPDGLTEPLSDLELRWANTYLTTPVQKWSYSAYNAVWKLCFPTTGNGRRSGCPADLVACYYQAISWRNSELKSLAGVVNYDAEDRAHAAHLLGQNQPSHDANKLKDADDEWASYFTNIKWMAALLLDKPSLWKQADIAWLDRYARDLPEETQDLLNARHKRETDPVVAPSVKTQILPTVAAVTVVAPPPRVDEPVQAPLPVIADDPDDEEEDDHSGFNDDRPSTPPDQRDVIEEREQTELVPPPKVASSKPALLFIAAITLLCGFVVGHFWNLLPSPPTTQTAEAPRTPLPPPVALRPIAPPIALTPLPPPAAPQPPAMTEVLRELRASDVGVDDLRRVHDGQIPSAVRFDHVRCSPPPSRNADGLTIDYSHCRWREVRSATNPTSAPSLAPSETINVINI